MGAKAPCTAVFEEQQYGGGNVYENTVKAAERAGLSLGQALPCGDVDTPEDLRRLVPSRQTRKAIRAGFWLH